jgi:hypothetical protein
LESDSPNIIFTFTDIKVNYKPQGENLFGPVIEGTLRIIGRHITAKASYGYADYEDFLRIVLDFGC